MHALWSCPSLGSVRDECAQLLGVQLPPHLDDRVRFFDVLVWLKQQVSLSVFITLCVSWWRVWSARNLFVHSGKVLNLANVVAWASAYVNETGVVLSSLGAYSLVRHIDVKWHPPNSNCYKVNTDASIDDHKIRTGLGVIIRDSRGIVMASYVNGFDSLYFPPIAEALVILRGITLAVQTGLLPICVELDAEFVVNLIMSKATPISEIGVVIEEILLLISMHPVYSVRFIPRLANRIAHGLAKFGLSAVGEFVWLEDYPLCVENLVLNDCSG
ncbi:hypothetical protein ACOSQ3_031019 [Xanthoceras sorbifolium]